MVSPRRGRLRHNPAVAGEQDDYERIALAIAGRARSGFALVAIDGTGGAGKSTLAAALARHLDGPGRAAIVHGDDFYRHMPARERLLLSPQEGYHQYFDWQRLRDQVLAPLASGQPARYQRYDWPAGQIAAGEMHHLHPCGTVLVEGVYTARPELADYYDLTILVDAPRDVCLQRLHQRGHDHGPGNWNERWRAAEEHYLAATSPATRLDMTVKGL